MIIYGAHSLNSFNSWLELSRQRKHVGIRPNFSSLDGSDRFLHRCKDIRCAHTTSAESTTHAASCRTNECACRIQRQSCYIVIKVRPAAILIAVSLEEILFNI